MLERIRQNSAEFGLGINMTKTEVMLIGTHDLEVSPEIDGTPLKIVDTFEYLGRILSRDGSDKLALNDRIGKAWGAFEKQKDLITSKHLSMKSKRDIYETYILPVVLYATETMTWSKDMLDKIDVFNNHIMRWMCGARLRDKKSISTLRASTGVKPIIPMIKARKLQWYGHIKRSDLLVKVTLEGLVAGKRKRGRPSRRWRDDIRDWCDDNLEAINKIARDRDLWRSHCYAVCNSGERV